MTGMTGCSSLEYALELMLTPYPRGLLRGDRKIGNKEKGKPTVVGTAGFVVLVRFFDLIGELRRETYENTSSDVLITFVVLEICDSCSIFNLLTGFKDQGIDIPFASCPISTQSQSLIFTFSICCKCNINLNFT